jgi:hypothetical protein
MTTNHIKQITHKLAEAVGQPLKGGKQKPDLILTDTHYKAANIDQFCDELNRYARLADLTLVVNHLY